MSRFSAFDLRECNTLLDIIGSRIEDLDCTFDESHTPADPFHPESEHYQFLAQIGKELTDRILELTEDLS